MKNYQSFQQFKMSVMQKKAESQERMQKQFQMQQQLNSEGAVKKILERVRGIKPFSLFF